MTEFTIFDDTNAPEGSKPLLANSKNSFGMIPNLHGVMAASPQHLEGYQLLHKLAQETSLTPTELDVVWLSINAYHECHYCVPAHTAIAKGKKTDDAVIDALRNQTPLPDAKLEALRAFTLKVTENRGVVADADVKAFLDAGFTNQTILDVVLVLAQKVMSNYINHLAHTPLDQPFQAFDWAPVAQAAE